MMDRISQICSFLSECESFADVACDHGYCAEYMLKNGLCRNAVISDISAQSLKKAQTLLSEYIQSGECRAVCCDGLEKIEGCDQVLIAGIGGEEIVRILKNSYVPEKFVFQPMKNADYLRAYLLDRGCVLDRDDIFYDGKNYYFIIKGRLSGESVNYTKAQLDYGRDSLNNDLIILYLADEREKKLSYLEREMSEKSRADIEKDIAFIDEVLNEIN